MFYFNKTMKALFAGFTFSLMPACVVASDINMNMKLEAGGLVLPRRENIAMVSQEVYVSAGLIEVNYIFLNRSKHDITTAVLFPLPPRPVSLVSGVSSPVRGNTTEENNFVRFETWVGSEKIEPAFRSERVTGFPYGLSQDVIHTTYYWEQTFPAGEPVYIRHRYTPVIGRGAALPTIDVLRMTQTEDYCPDGTFKASVYYKATHEKYNYASYDDIGYILTDGKNWAGGTIRNFRLVVNKGSPDALVTFCGTGVQKISPTKFETRVKNFRPRRDVHVFILRDWSREKHD